MFKRPVGLVLALIFVGCMAVIGSIWFIKNSSERESQASSFAEIARLSVEVRGGIKTDEGYFLFDVDSPPQLEIHLKTPAFVSIWVDDSNGVRQAFPSDGQPYVLEGNKPLLFPNDQSPLVLDNSEVVESIVVVASKEAPPSHASLFNVRDSKGNEEPEGKVAAVSETYGERRSARVNLPADSLEWIEGPGIQAERIQFKAISKNSKLTFEEALSVIRSDNEKTVVRLWPALIHQRRVQRSQGNWSNAAEIATLMYRFSVAQEIAEPALRVLGQDAAQTQILAADFEAARDLLTEIIRRHDELYESDVRAREPKAWLELVDVLSASEDKLDAWREGDIGQNLVLLALAEKGMPSREVIDQFFDGRAKAVGEDHPLMVAPFHYRGRSAGQTAPPNIAQCMSDFGRAMELSRKHLGEDHPTSAYISGQLGWAYLYGGRPMQAMAAFENGLNTFAPLQDEYYVSMANIWTGINQFRQRQGDLAGSRRALDQAIALFDKHFSLDEPSVDPDNATRVLTELLLSHSATSRQLGNWEKALESTQRAHELYSKMLPADHPDRLAVLVEQSRIELGLGKKEGLLGFREYIDTIHREEDENYNLLLAFQQLGAWELHYQEFDNAAETLEAAKVLCHSLNRWDFPETINLSRSLAVSSRHAGDLKAAYEYLNHSTQLADEHVGLNSWQENLTQSERARTLLKEGKQDEAVELLYAVWKAKFDVLQNSLSVLPAKESLWLQDATWHSLVELLTHSAGTDPDRSYAALISTRSAITDALTRSRRAGNSGASQELQKRLTMLQSQLAGSFFGRGGQKSLRAEELKRLRDEVEQLQLSLVGTSESYSIAIPALADVAARLPEHQVIVEFVQVPRVSAGTEGAPAAKSYDVFIVRAADGELEIERLALGQVDVFDELLSVWMETIESGLASSEGAEAAEDLYAHLWAPIENRLKESDRVILIPDGQIASLPWAALPTPNNGAPLLEQRIISLAGSVRQVLPPPNATAKSNDQLRLLAVGGVDFDLNSDSEVVSGQPRRSVELDISPGVLGNWNWAALPKSESEVADIAKRFTKDEATVLTGGQAIEGKVTEWMPKCSIIHFATHGFFWEAAQNRGTAQQPVIADDFGIARQNPLLLSGVVLAGANSENPGNDASFGDGLLTGIEVANLPLSDTDLVVLSACDSSRGVQLTGEGVMSLQRAFHVAGAKAVVASLWKVDDQRTAKLMDRYYELMVDGGKTRLEALREAQLAMYRGELTTGESHVADWAGWVYSGLPE